MEPIEQPVSSESLSAFPNPYEPANLDPAPPAPPKHAFFMGRFGLRAGYGLAIFLVVFFIISALAGIVALTSTHHLKEVIDARMYAQTHPGAPRPHLHIPFTPGFVIAEDAFAFLAVLAMCFVFSKAEKRKLRVYGIGPNRIVDIIPGAVIGLAMLAALVGTLRAAHVLVFDGQNVHGTAMVTSGVMWLIAFLFVGFAEEYEFRGYIQYTLMRGVWGLAERISSANARDVAFWIAATIWSGLFACAHLGNAGENKFGIFAVFLAGMTLSYTLWWTGSLWWGIGWHMAWDWAQSFLFGVADSGNISEGRLFITHPTGKPLLSGGADGPEGSIFVIAALVITVVLCRYTARRGVQPSLEREDPQTHAIITT